MEIFMQMTMVYAHAIIALVKELIKKKRIMDRICLMRMK
jgi:hypothetical protein